MILVYYIMAYYIFFSYSKSEILKYAKIKTVQKHRGNTINVKFIFLSNNKM